jgi:hypothetical protein
MEWESYELEKNKDGLKYGFYSNGPRGTIRKEVRFQSRPELGRNVYNLAFGDYDERTDSINDKIVSNNGDRATVLHAVADIVMDFLERRPFAIILVRGTTKSRVRLYQMGITIFLTELKKRYEVLGKHEGSWALFKKVLTMKSLSYLKKSAKFIRPKEVDMIRKKNTVKRVKTPTIRIVDDWPVNENDPFLIRKEQEAIKSLTETPLPEWLLNRDLHIKKKAR